MNSSLKPRWLLLLVLSGCWPTWNDWHDEYDDRDNDGHLWASAGGPNCDDCTGSLRNVIISNNRAIGHGGGIYFTGVSQPILVDAVISGNSTFMMATRSPMAMTHSTRGPDLLIAKAQLIPFTNVNTAVWPSDVGVTVPPSRQTI